ncbi:hypothetical protein [Pseudomonas huaxiensis]|uniref:hypothetical protein n=1 Tax=Pseudomonas huaxiensis TaxID=2213017 RepID=UPI0013009BB7|nr:hypothetical protein [Pseudomonas huaxiensis]
MSIDNITAVVGIVGAVLTTLTVFYEAFKNEESRKILRAILKSQSAKDFFENYLNLTKAMLNMTFMTPKESKKIARLINLSLVRSITILMERVVSSNDEKKANTIVGLMLNEKIEKTFAIQILLTIAIAADFAFNLLAYSNFDGTVLIIASVIWISTLIDHKLIEYRIRNGWYGKNEFEACEIIRFALKHTDKNDFNDEGGLKRIIPLPDIPAEEARHGKAWGTNA